jgi:2-aminoethylphosphonate-pyruvate transaminase
VCAIYLLILVPVKQAMMVDHCTWDEEYKTITQEIRQKLLSLAGASPVEYTTILMQGSGSFGVESVLSSVIGPTDHVLVCVNGAYGRRMVSMCERHHLAYSVYEVAEDEIPQATDIKSILVNDPTISALDAVTSIGISPKARHCVHDKQQLIVFGKCSNFF